MLPAAPLLDSLRRTQPEESQCLVTQHRERMERVLGCPMKQFLRAPGVRLRRVLEMLEHGKMDRMVLTDPGGQCLESILQHLSRHSIRPEVALAATSTQAIPAVLDLAALAAQQSGSRILKAALITGCRLIECCPCRDLFQSDLQTQASLAHLLAALRRPSAAVAPPLLDLLGCLTACPSTGGVALLLRHNGVAVMCHCARASPEAARRVCQMLSMLSTRPAAAPPLSQQGAAGMLVDLMSTAPPNDCCDADNGVWLPACKALITVRKHKVSIPAVKLAALLAQLSAAIELTYVSWGQMSSTSAGCFIPLEMLSLLCLDAKHLPALLGAPALGTLRSAVIRSSSLAAQTQVQASSPAALLIHSMAGEMRILAHPLLMQHAALVRPVSIEPAAGLCANKSTAAPACDELTHELQLAAGGEAMGSAAVGPPVWWPPVEHSLHRTVPQITASIVSANHAATHSTVHRPGSASWQSWPEGLVQQTCHASAV